MQVITFELAIAGLSLAFLVLGFCLGCYATHFRNRAWRILLFLFVVVSFLASASGGFLLGGHGYFILGLPGTPSHLAWDTDPDGRGLGNLVVGAALVILTLMGAMVIGRKARIAR